VQAGHEAAVTRFKRLVDAIETERFLAERHYGVSLDPVRHKDLIDGHAAVVRVLAKLLNESKEIVGRRKKGE